jgi:hypothetical protein
MGAKRRNVSTDPNQPRCKHNILWGQCALCRGRFGMLVIELDRMFFSPQPPEFVGNLVVEAIRKMRIRREAKISSESSRT